jgi:uncharacterized membrane protein YozB (DUF420 family)
MVRAVLIFALIVNLLLAVLAVVLLGNGVTEVEISLVTAANHVSISASPG